MNDRPDDAGSNSSEPLYYDPIDEPSPGSTLLVTLNDLEDEQSWCSDSLETCLRGYLLYYGHDSSEWVFRRVAETDNSHQLEVRELPSGQKGEGPNLSLSGRLLACYYTHVSYRRTIQISPEVGEPFGIREIYMHVDEIGENYSYLDRTGKVRPINMLVSGDAVEFDCDDDYRRELIEDAVLGAGRERIFPYK